MVTAVLLFLSIATGEVTPIYSKDHALTQEACQAMIDHDLPVLQARAATLTPGTFEITGKCVPSPVTEDDGSI